MQRPLLEAQRAGQRVAMEVGAPNLHGGRVGISSSMWRAVKWPAWEATLGLFRDELDLGPKMKFAQPAMLYNFDEMTMLIRPAN